VCISRIDEATNVLIISEREAWVSSSICPFIKVYLNYTDDSDIICETEQANICLCLWEMLPFFCVPTNSIFSRDSFWKRYIFLLIITNLPPT
jgi:hypothetical protein